MKSIEQQLSSYKSVHLNKHNITTHFFGIPLIIWSVALLLTYVDFPVEIMAINVNITLTVLLCGLVLLYYFILSPGIAVCAVLLFGPIIYSAIYLAHIDNKMVIALSAFVIGWILQGIGHHFEKAKPAFIDDLNQLLIGPLFLVSKAYFLLGFDKQLAKNIDKNALEQRKAFEEA